MSVMLSNYLILRHSLLLLPSIFPSIRIFSSELAFHIREPKYWNFSFSISSSNEYSGLISFRTDQFDLLAVQRTLKSLLQFENIIYSALSLLYHPTLTSVYDHWKKTIASLTIWTCIGKVMSLLFNTLSRSGIAFLPRGKHLVISWLQSPSALILETKKIKFVTVSTFFPSICHEVMGPDAMSLVFLMLSFKPAFILSSFILIKWFFSSSSLSAIRVVSSAYLRFLIFLQAILIPACESSSPVFHVMYSACKLNKQGDNIQP